MTAFRMENRKGGKTSKEVSQKRRGEKILQLWDYEGQLNRTK